MRSRERAHAPWGYSQRFIRKSHIILFVLGLVLMQTSAGLALETWDVEFTGDGHPNAQGWGMVGSNYHVYDSRFTPSGTFPGWITASGNPGSYYYYNDAVNLTKAAGWTYEWSMETHPSYNQNFTGEFLRIHDGSWTSLNLNPAAGTVTLWDRYWNAPKVSTSIQLWDPDPNVAILRTYRLVRQPNGPVELYVDNDFSAPLLTLDPLPVGGGAGSMGTQLMSLSNLESAWDYWRYHSGASLPSPPPPPSPAGIYIPSEVQYGANQQAYSVNPAVNNHAVLPDEPSLPSLWKQGDTMQIMAARGEYEPATFVVNTDTPLQAVDVQVGQLTGAAGTLPAQTLDVRVAQPYYKRVTNWYAELPWVLVHDPNLFTIIDETPPGADPTRYTKTNLLTSYAIDTDTLQPADVTDRQQFWITAHIPENAAPGTYTAPVTVTSANGPATELTLQVRVPNLELLEPKAEYSVYYPAFYGWPNGEITHPQYAHLSETQYVNEMRDMVAHGLTNPVFYQGISANPDGSVDFSLIEEHISLREQGGMNFQGKPLYLPDNPMLIVQRDLTPEEYARNVSYTQQIVAWAQQRGYGDVYFMGNDESGLDAQLDSFRSIHDGGGKIWNSVTRVSGLTSSAVDVLDLPILQHPGHVLWDQGAEAVTAEEFLLNPESMQTYGAPEWMMTPEIQAAIDAVHQNGYKIFSYMDPTGGQTLPEVHRRFRGVGLWKVGLDGTMTWAYTHIGGNDVSFADGDPLPNLINSLVFRGEEAPFDTLAFEGFREGVDDARYLATLLDAMDQALLRGEYLDLVDDTAQWLAGLNPNTVDLDAMRLEMAWRIEVLNPIPEPATLVVLALGGLAVLIRRKS